MRNGLSYNDAGKLGAEKSKIKSAELKQGRIDEYNKNPKLCKQCEASIPYEKRVNNFCGSSCSATFNNTKRGRKLVCVGCGNDFSPRRLNVTCCSRKCSVEVSRRLVFEEIKRKFEKGEPVSSRRAKTFLISLWGEKCVNCGWCERNVVTGKVPIELEHIDGNSENNTLSNLTLLCPNCHSLTPTYKALNVGNGRAYRRKRYKEGKSY